MANGANGLWQTGMVRRAWSDTSEARQEVVRERRPEAVEVEVEEDAPERWSILHCIALDWNILHLHCIALHWREEEDVALQH